MKRALSPLRHNPLQQITDKAKRYLNNAYINPLDYPDDAIEAIVETGRHEYREAWYEYMDEDDTGMSYLKRKRALYEKG